jgi:hypothetical protein
MCNDYCTLANSRQDKQCGELVYVKILRKTTNALLAVENKPSRRDSFHPGNN